MARRPLPAKAVVVLTADDARLGLSQLRHDSRSPTCSVTRHRTITRLRTTDISGATLIQRVDVEGRPNAGITLCHPKREATNETPSRVRRAGQSFSTRPPTPTLPLCPLPLSSERLGVVNVHETMDRRGLSRLRRQESPLNLSLTAKQMFHLLLSR